MAGFPSPVEATGRRPNYVPRPGFPYSAEPETERE